MKCVRLYADDGGETHFEDVDVPLSLVDTRPARALDPRIRVHSRCCVCWPGAASAGSCEKWSQITACRTLSGYSKGALDSLLLILGYVLTQLGTQSFSVIHLSHYAEVHS